MSLSILNLLEHPQQMLQKNDILTHQKPTLLFYHIILQHLIY